MGKVVRMSDKKINDNEELEEVVVEEILDENCEAEVETEDSQDSLEQENIKLKEEIETLKNDYLKAFADTENLKKRLQREHEQTRKYRIQSFALSILPVIDNLERALSQETSDEAFREGVQMIYDQLMDSLKSEGVTPIEALNQEFDPNIHQAMMMEEIEGVEPNIVVQELQKGYMLKDRILRASLVKVSQ